jgi:hypothetical protein
VGRNLDVKDADLRVGENLVVMRLGSNFDVGLGLRGKKSGQEEKQETTMHSRIVASRLEAVGSAHSSLQNRGRRFAAIKQQVPPFGRNGKDLIGMRRIGRNDKDLIGMTGIGRNGKDSVGMTKISRTTRI